jgi:hypothetical protein
MKSNASESASQAVAFIAALISASNSVRLPSSALSIAPLIAPHAVWPITSHFHICQFAGELHAAQNIRVTDVSDNPAIKDVVNSKIINVGS